MDKSFQLVLDEFPEMKDEYNKKDMEYLSQKFNHTLEFAVKEDQELFKQSLLDVFTNFGVPIELYDLFIQALQKACSILNINRTAATAVITQYAE